MAACRHLKILKIRILSFDAVCRPNIRHHAKFHDKPLQRYGYFSIYQNGSLFKSTKCYLPVWFRGPICVTMPYQLYSCRDMADFRFSKMAADCQLGYIKISNSTCRSGSEDQYALPCQISHWTVKPFRRYGHFWIFQDCGHPPSWISYTPVWTTHVEYLVVTVTVQNLVEISAVVSIICKS